MGNILNLFRKNIEMNRQNAQNKFSKETQNGNQSNSSNTNAEINREESFVSNVQDNLGRHVELTRLSLSTSEKLIPSPVPKSPFPSHTPNPQGDLEPSMMVETISNTTTGRESRQHDGQRQDDELQQHNGFLNSTDKMDKILELSKKIPQVKMDNRCLQKSDPKLEESNLTICKDSSNESLNAEIQDYIKLLSESNDNINMAEDALKEIASLYKQNLFITNSEEDLAKHEKLMELITDSVSVDELRSNIRAIYENDTNSLIQE